MPHARREASLGGGAVPEAPSITVGPTRGITHMLGAQGVLAGSSSEKMLRTKSSSHLCTQGPKVGSFVYIPPKAFGVFVHTYL